MCAVVPCRSGSNHGTNGMRLAACGQMSEPALLSLDQAVDGDVCGEVSDTHSPVAKRIEERLRNASHVQLIRRTLCGTDGAVASLSLGIGNLGFDTIHASHLREFEQATVEEGDGSTVIGIERRPRFG